MGSVGEIVVAGGPVLLVLCALSVYSLALIWERWSYFKSACRGLDPFLDRLRHGIERGDLTEAMALSKQYRGAASDIIMAALVGPTPKEERQRSTERSLERQLARFQRGVGTLGTIGSVAPFIGLFGTVLGVMRAFRDLAGSSGAGPGVVAIGISEALVTTAGGLFVAIPAIVAHNYFTTRTSRFADDLRWLTEEILERLTERAR